MHIELNLAKEPFRNRSVFWLAMAAGYLVALTALLVVLTYAGAVGADTEELRAEAATQQETIAELERRVEEIKQERSTAVFTPEDRQALDDARLLINKKTFSWTRLFNDLEPFVPRDAKLTNIAINSIEGDGASRVVTMTIAGRGKSFSQMGAFIANLDGSGGRFSAEPVSNGPDQQSQEFMFTINVRYRPGVSVAPAQEGANG